MNLKNLFIGSAMAFALIGCSQAAFQAGVQNGVRNLAAADCASPASQAAFVANLPPNPFVNGAQQAAIMAQACMGLFGTVAAPLTAAGNVAALPAAVAAPLAAPVSPLPASK